MSVVYEVCPGDVQQSCRTVMQEHHKELSDYGANIMCMFASAEDSKGEVIPAVKLHGRACYATVRSVPARDRAMGMPDAVIMIDKNAWKSLSNARQVALLDHELTHLIVNGTDDNSHPTFEMRKHDWELHGFSEVIQRNGIDAIELRDMGKFKQSKDGQLIFETIEAEARRAVITLTKSGQAA